MPKNYYDIKTLQDYLAGRLDARAMHQLEKQALEDPLLAEALEGLESSSDLPSEDLSLVMDRLQNRLDSRVSQAGESARPAALTGEETAATAETAAVPIDIDNAVPVKSLYSYGARKRWLGAAAMIILLLGGGWLYFAMEGHAPQRMQKPVGYDKEIASAVTDALSDSNSNISKGNTELPKRSDNKSGEPHNDSENPPREAEQLALSAGNKEKKNKDKEPKSRDDEYNADYANQLAMGRSKTAVLSKQSAPTAALEQGTLIQPRALNAPRLQLLKDSAVVIGYSAVKPIDAGHVAGSLDSIAGLSRIAAAPSDVQPAINIRGANPLGGTRIRGLGRLMDSLSPNKNTEPLFVIDGVPVSGSNRLDTLDPANIDHLTVLKGEQAAAIYGARAINGVVLISTKKQGEVAIVTNKETAQVLGPQVVFKKIADKNQPKDNSNAGSIKDLTAGTTVIKANGKVAGKVPGKAVRKGLGKTAAKPLLQVRVDSISGHLQPAGGFSAFEKYLNHQLLNELWNEDVSILDTGKVYVEVRIDPKDNGRGLLIQFTSKENTNKSLKAWINKIIGRGPAWETVAGYKGPEANGPAKLLIQVFSSNKLSN